MKKAAVNLSQQFSVYIPSKRLQLFEQKRMLSKQLQDFLHIYRKDTDHLRLDSSTDAEIQKYKLKNKLFHDTALTNFLNKCTEAQLEEVMSSYMRNSKDSATFLGISKNSKPLRRSPSVKSRNEEKTYTKEPKGRERSSSVESCDSIPSNNSETAKQLSKNKKREIDKLNAEIKTNMAQFNETSKRLDSVNSANNNPSKDLIKRSNLFSKLKKLTYSPVYNETS